ncbi:hypothetical protein, partial [Teichococcus vastitatis]|uniref:hypothetical protein n=1 Tax=Teichococcus vastitatis TaxID=2307076 RepID=UPI00192E75AB
MFDPAGAAIRVTLPELPQTYAGSRIAILEGQSATIRFDRTDTTREATFVFRPPIEQDGIAAQFFGYDPARPPVIHFAAGEVGPKYLTIGAVENTASDGLPETLWGFEAISGISRFEGLEEPPGSSEMLPVIFLNNDVSAERDIVTGGSGDDVFAPGGSGDDSFNGSYGIDTVTLLGLRAQYAVQTQPLRFGPRVFDQVEGRDGTDSVLNV